MPHAGPNFEAIFTESVRDGLRFALGPSGLEMLQRGYGLEEVIHDSNRLHTLLTTIFAAHGTVVLERQITKELFDRVGIRFYEDEAETFDSRIRRAREAYDGGASLRAI